LDKILLTGNPIRRSSVDIEGKRREALAAFGLEEGRKTIVVTGGSLGAKTLNGFMLESIDKIASRSDLQVIWQCGGYYYEQMKEILALERTIPDNVKLMPFLQRMDYAYAAADVIIARAGAGTISELCVIGKPAILVPSPNVAEDHQTKNAQALVDNGAAVLVRDSIARDSLFDVVTELLADEERCAILGAEIKKMALPDADEVIAKEVLGLIV